MALQVLPGRACAVTVPVELGSSGLADDANLRPPNKKPPGPKAQEVAGERDVAFAVR